MVTKKLSLAILVFFLVVQLMAFASATTASIGNSRMILRVEPNQEITRYVLVRNVNEEEVKIDLDATGDLAHNVRFKETEFTLIPGAERKAYFTIEADEEGTTETAINVRFTPLTEKNGVGLTSVVIVISKDNIDSPSDEIDSPDFEGVVPDDTEPADEVTTEDEQDAVTFNPTNSPVGDPTLDPQSSQSQTDFSPTIFLTFSTLVLAILLIILLIYGGKKKTESRPEKKAEAKKKVRRSNA